MNNTEKVAALEDLLARVKRNAAVPRAFAPTPALADSAPTMDAVLDEPTIAEPPTRAPVAPPPAAAIAAARPPAAAAAPATKTVARGFGAGSAKPAVPAPSPSRPGPRPAVPAPTPSRPSGGAGLGGFGKGLNLGGERKAGPPIPRTDSEPSIAAVAAPSPKPPVVEEPIAAQRIVAVAEAPVDELLPIVDGTSAPPPAQEEPEAVVAAAPPPELEPEPTASVDVASADPFSELSDPTVPLMSLAEGEIVSPAAAPPAPEPEPAPPPAAEPAPKPSVIEPAPVSAPAAASFATAPDQEAPSKFAAEAAPPQKKSRTGLSLLVVGLVAIVVGGGVLLYLKSQETPTPAPKATHSEKATTSTATATATAVATATATATATAEVTATADTSAEAPPGDTPKDPKSLPASLGYLIVTAPKDVDVFSNGKKVGTTNAALEIGCVPSQKFITVGEQTAAGTKFLAIGKRSAIACQDVTRLEFTDADFATGPATPPQGGALPVPTGGTTTGGGATTGGATSGGGTTTGGAPTAGTPTAAPTEPYEPQAP